MQHKCSAGPRGRPPPISCPPSSLLPRCSTRVPAGVGALTVGGRGLCSLLLSLLSDPSGSSDSLHSGSPSVRARLPSLPVVCQCLSPTSPALSPPLCCLVSFHRSQPRSHRVEGSALFAQTAATPGRPRTNLPAPLLPYGPQSLRRCCRRLHRVEGDPDPTLFLRPDIKRTKSPTRRR